MALQHSLLEETLQLATHETNLHEKWMHGGHRHPQGLLHVVSGHHGALVQKQKKEPVIRLAGNLSLIITPKSQQNLILNAGHLSEKHGEQLTHSCDKPLHPKYSVEISMDKHRQSLCDFMRHGRNRLKARHPD